MKKRVKSDYSKLSEIKEKSINIKSLFKFNLFNTLVAGLLVYIVLVGYGLFGKNIYVPTVFRSPGQPLFYGAIIQFILYAALVLTLLGWLVLAYYKRLDKERPA